MEIISFFTRNEPVAGLEIAESGIRFVLLDKVKETQSVQPVWKRIFAFGSRGYRTKVKSAAEIVFDKEVIVNGAIKDRAAFVAAMKALLKKAGSSVQYAVVSIPFVHCYVRSFSFPKTVSDKKIIETIESVAELQMPKSKEESYFSWQKIATDKETVVLVAVGDRGIVNDYIMCLLEAGVNVVALEFHSMSAGRLLSDEVDGAKALVLSELHDGTITIFDRQALRFCHVVQRAVFDSPDRINEELLKCQSFIETEKGVLVTSVISDKERLLGKRRSEVLVIALPEYAAPAMIAESATWVVAFGAALRGFMPRYQDNDISLTSLSTRKAYEREKALVFGKLFSNIIVGLSIFFTLLFFGFWLVALALERSYFERVTILDTAALPTEGANLEQRAQMFNDTVQRKASLLGSFTRWSVVLNEIKRLQGVDISIAHFNISTDGQVTISGVASSRVELKRFKKDLEESSMFSSVDLPISNLAPRQNVSFNARFFLKSNVAKY